METLRRSLLVGGAALALTGCEYTKLLRPSVLKQLDPDVARLVNELPRRSPARPGRIVWEYRAPHPIVASLLATAGGLVFEGEPTGEFKALEARTGAVLWSFRTGSGIHSNPITYSVAGKQYVAVASGWGGWLKGFAPDTYGANRGSALFVFALP